MLEILSGISLLVSFVASIWLIVVAFKKSTGWGFGVWFVPFVSIIFIYKFWDDAKKPFLVSLSSAILSGVFLMSSFLSNSSEGMPLETAVELAKKAPTNHPIKNLTEEEVQALIMMEKTIEMMGKLPASDKQQHLLKVMQKTIQFKRIGFSEEEQTAFKKDMTAFLDRNDLNKKQRQNFENIFHEITNQKLPVVANLPIPSQEHEIAATDSGQKIDVVQTAGNFENSNQATDKKEPENETVSLKSSLPLKRSPQLIDPENFSGEKRGSPPFKRITFSQAKNYIGQEISFRGPWGKDQECTLVGASDKQIQCSKHMNSGSFSVSYKKGEVKSLKVLRQ